MSATTSKKPKRPIHILTGKPGAWVYTTTVRDAATTRAATRRYKVQNNIPLRAHTVVSVRDNPLTNYGAK